MVMAGPAQHAFYCQSCRASLAVYGVVSVTCPYCGKPMAPPCRIRIVELQPKVMRRWSPFDLGDTMFALIKKYAIEIVAALGYIASIATALGLTRYHWVSVALGVASTVSVVLTKFFTVTRPAARAAAGKPAAR